MKDKKSISGIKLGMNIDAHIGQLKNTEYSFALNANTNSETEGFNIQNEPSNYYGVSFPSGYKVIGYRNDLLQERTYYLLTNPNTRKSSVGYVINNVQDQKNIDQEQECTDCTKYNEISTPLEDTTQTPSLQYIELFNDNCLIDAGKEGLNFDVNYPVKKIEIKQEKLGTTIYFNDNRNPKRYINVSDISYLFTQEVPCGEDITVDCLLVDKLLVFPKHNRIKINADKLQVGGNLKLGTYEFYAVYCDLLGNEITQYSTPTNPISIFDDNNNILSDTDVFTNFSIKLTVDNLDTLNFKYYKVVCVERNNVSNTQSAFIEGIHPTTDNVVNYTHSGSSSDDFVTRGNVSIKRRVDFNKLNLIKPSYDKAETTMVSGGRLFSKGLTRKEEINLQPVVNLFSSLAEWITTAAKEDLYKSAIATSKYKGYHRDEVQAFGIRFIADGDYTATFPFVGRPILSGEDEIVEDKNYQSILNNTPSCANNERDKKWQIFNTASVKETCTDLNTGTEVIESTSKICVIENVHTIEANSTDIELIDNYTNLIDYIEDNPDVVIPGVTEYLEDEYADIHCIPNFGIPYTSGKLIVGASYIIYNLNAGDDFSNVGYLTDGEVFTATEEEPTVWSNETEVIKTNCDTPELESSMNTIAKVIGETVVKTEIEFPNEYQRLKSPEYCNIYKQDYTSGSTDLISDTKFQAEFMYKQPYPFGRLYYTVFERDYNFTNETCFSAEDIIDTTNANVTGGSYFHNYRGEVDLADLQTTKTATEVTTNFTNKIHKGGLWFKAAVNNRENFILEISKIKDQGDKDDIIHSNFNPNKEVRLSFFNTCSSTTPFYSKILSLRIEGGIFKITTNYTTGDVTINDGVTSTVVNVPNTFPSGRFFIAVDDPIYECSGIEEYIDADTSDTQTEDLVDKYRTAPVDGCYSIITKDLTYIGATISWDSIVINKTETYTSSCKYILPNVDDCDPKPFNRGRFAFWESTKKYPDNKQLYDSSDLLISQDDLSLLSTDKIDDFEDYFTVDGTTDIDGNYILKPSTDLTCQKIRHPKFPDNTIAPFMYDNNALKKLSETVIFPLGISLDSKVVVAMLNVALKNNLITQKEFDSIQGYEILRGDNVISKSIIASGLGYDMYNYEKENNEKWWYANFPFNDLGEDKYHTTDASRRNLVQHPYNSQKNHLFSFLSPDVFLTKPSLPTEMAISGYQFGNATESFTEIEKHPKYTILGGKARTLATTLAIAEVALEILVKVGEMTSRQFFIFGFSSGGSLGFAGAGIVAGAYTIQGFIKVGQYRYQWLQTFRDLGSAYNFASMNVGVGKYNRFLKTEQNSENYLRGLSLKKYLKDGMFTAIDENDASTVNINNWLREDSVLLSSGEDYQVEYPNEYINYDNNKVNSKSSKIINSDISCNSNLDSVRDIASPYITLKNYIPDQWDTIDSIKWLTTNHIYNLEDDTECSPIFGGTVCISPFSWRRKTPLFRSTGMGLPDRLPFNYSDQRNIAYTKYYIDYEVDTEYNSLFLPFPDIDSDYTVDCSNGSRKFYLKPPSKIYLYSYGIVNFLVESEINCHFRYARRERNDWFYPQVSNVADWVQESKMSITEPNTFFYNNTYSFPVSNTPYKFLDYTYDKEVWRKRNYQPNAVIYSEQERNENDLIDPWLIYKPLNWYEYKTQHGKLIDIKDIESTQFLARFENGLIINNAIDNLADRITPQNKELGTAGLFAERPIEFKTTDLGFAGTQHTEICSTPYGHFWVDAKRGRVFQIDQNGKNIEVISEQVQGKPTNMKQWFREHLPFKILNYIPNLDIDNKFKGIGMNIWYDDRNSRVFFTKRDYVLKSGVDKNDFIFTDRLLYQDEEVFFDNEDLFEDVSWTLSYKPTEGGWGSYFSFYPDYSPFHNNFFQAGYNWGEDKETLWNHTMGNSSFQVFQGRLNPFIVEYPVQNENVNKQLNTVSLNIEARRYQNDWDYSIWKDKGFNKLSIFNNTKHTGLLNLYAQKMLTDSRKYPITNSDSSQDILFTANEGKHNINYFFNRVINQDRNIPIFNKDRNSIFKDINPKAVSFKGKRTLERMTGESFIVSLTNDNESRFNIILKNSINDETVYE